MLLTNTMTLNFSTMRSLTPFNITSFAIYPSTMTSLPLYYPSIGPSTITPPPFYYNITIPLPRPLYYDVTNPSTMTSLSFTVTLLNLYYDVSNLSTMT